MSNFNYVTSIRSMNMHATTKLVAVILATYADYQTGECYPTIETLMSDTGLSNRVICHHIKELENLKILVVNRSNGRRSYYKFIAENITKAVTLVQEAVTQSHQLRKVTSDSNDTKAVTLVQEAVTFMQKAVTESHTNYHKQPLTISEQPIIEKSKPEKPKRISKKQASINRLVELGCDEKYAHDWMVARKGSELTDSILENLAEHAAKANISIARAVEWSAKKGYQGFKANWYLEDQKPQNTGYQSSAQQTANEQAKWDDFLKSGNQFVDVTPKKSFLTEGVGHA